MRSVQKHNFLWIGSKDILDQDNVILILARNSFIKKNKWLQKHGQEDSFLCNTLDSEHEVANEEVKLRPYMELQSLWYLSLSIVPSRTLPFFIRDCGACFPISAGHREKNKCWTHMAELSDLQDTDLEPSQMNNERCKLSFCQGCWRKQTSLTIAESWCWKGSVNNAHTAWEHIHSTCYL